MASISFWGEAVPNWVSALGTVGALVAAIALALMERSRAEAAEGERDRLRTELDSVVASRVAGRFERVPTEIRTGEHFRWATPETWRVIVRNASDQVVADVKAYLVHADGGKKELVGSWDVVPPLDTVQTDRAMLVEVYNEEPYLVLTFSDPTGRRWSRGEHGRLEVVEDE